MSRIEERLRFEPDGSITAFSGKMDYGQGLHAAYPRIVAEELTVGPSRVTIVLGDTDLTPWDMGTFGSMSVEMDGLELRRRVHHRRIGRGRTGRSRASSMTRQCECRASSQSCMRDDPATAMTLAAAATTCHARYYTPHIAAAPLGPSVGVADVRASTEARRGRRGSSS